MEISVIIPAYNQGRYLGAAIRSVLEQTRQDFEIIVVDDGSTDDTRAVVQAFVEDPRQGVEDPRVSPPRQSPAGGQGGQGRDAPVRYVYQENRGLSAARNTGIRHAQGRYLSYLDSDDQFLPRKLELLLAAIEHEPEIGLVAGQAILVDDAGRTVGRIFDQPLPDDPAHLLLGNPLHVGSVLIRREWQQRVGFFDETLRSYEDWDMWLRLALAGCPMRYVTQPVSLYRFHPAQMTRIGAQMTAATIAVLDKVYADPSLPESWRALRDRAYSRASLRAAAQAYMAGVADQGAACISQAVALDPALMADGGSPLARCFSAWLDLPKTDDPLGFMERVYESLPMELAELKAQRSRAIGRLAMRLAFEAHARGDMGVARRAARAAFRRDPKWFSNRGAVVVLIRSHMSPGERQLHA